MFIIPPILVGQVIDMVILPNNTISAGDRLLTSKSTMVDVVKHDIWASESER